MKQCHSCLKGLTITFPVGRQESCPYCGADLHCCLNCLFYTKGIYNDCREPQAERVTEKIHYNFCDYFTFRDARPGNGEQGILKNPKEKLESLFRKSN